MGALQFLLFDNLRLQITLAAFNQHYITAFLFSGLVVTEIQTGGRKFYISILVNKKGQIEICPVEIQYPMKNRCANSASYYNLQS